MKSTNVQTLQANALLNAVILLLEELFQSSDLLFNEFQVYQTLPRCLQIRLDIANSLGHTGLANSLGHFDR